MKITISISPDLSQALGAYAEIYAETYGAVEPVQELIPAMLATFLEICGARRRDRRDPRAGERRC